MNNLNPSSFNVADHTIELFQNAETFLDMQNSNPEGALAEYKFLYPQVSIDGQKYIVRTCREWAKNLDGVNGTLANEIRIWVLGPAHDLIVKTHPVSERPTSRGFLQSLITKLEA